MKRSAWLVGLLAMLVVPFISRPQAAVSLEQGFQNPPPSARPRVWWHWMNGNVTEEGIRLDLEWMNRVGIGGVQNFDAALDTPQVVEKRLAYMTPEWKHAFRTAVATADRLGLEFAIASSPGWSETGGPWVKPEDAMKKLVWSETDVTGRKRFQGKLAAPPSTTGPFQDLGMQAEIGASQGKSNLPALYRDAFVLAYRVPSAGSPPQPQVSSAGGTVNADILFDGKLDRGLNVPADGAKPGWLRFDFPAVQSISAVTLSVPPAPQFGESPFLPVLEASADGVTYRQLGTFPSSASPQNTIAFAPVNVKSIRITFQPNSPGGSPAPAAPGAVVGAIGGIRQEPAPASALEVRFFAEPRVNRFEAKAGFAMASDYYALAAPPVAGGTPLSAVINLTAKMGPDGSLDWTPPAGTWRILRLGYSLTGKENHPATAEATGFEVDKFDADAVRRYINTYLDTYLDAAGAAGMGAKGIRAVLNDSIEVGSANWTPRLLDEFKARRGYDPTLWLPALTGAVIENQGKTDAFLYDFRRTLADLIADAHYRTVTAEVHKRGLTHYSEALESGRPTIGDDMDMRRGADIPMSAMWTYAEGTGPRATSMADIRGAASVAHVYGQNLVAAESLTAMFSPWAFAPKNLQPMIDMEFALGVNRPVIHTSVHQPLTDHAPGFSLAIFGQYFNRLDTWTEMAKPWVTYIARNAYMLQQGRFVADVAYFYGEEAPLTALFNDRPPTDLPAAYGFDYVNADVLLNQLTNDGDSVAAKSGARYRVIYLGGTSQHMTLPVLKRLETLVHGGATVVGMKPTGSPALMDDPVEFAKIASKLWSGKTGKGRVLATSDISAALTTLKIAPDFAYTKPAPDTTLMFVHRQRPDADIYYFTNRKARAENLELRFRVTGKRPELWDAETGAASPVSYQTENGQTVIPIALAPHQSGYIVFREATTNAERTVSRKVSTPVQTLGDPWSVSFQSGRGVPAEPYAMAAGDWSKDSDSRVRYFSGTASYRRNVTVISSWLTDGQRLMLDLGDVGEVAEVLLNGKSAGIAWRAPYRVDITKFVKPGENALEVRVANLWVNRLIGDAQPGAQKIAFTTLPTYRADAPLRPSGLLGPVRLQVER